MSQSAAFPATTTRTDSRSSLWMQLFTPVALAPLVYFRMAFGAIMLWEVWRYSTYNWIHRYYIEPTFHFTYLGFDWVQPWPGGGMYLHFLVLAALALCIMIGLAYRLSATLFFLGFTYVFLLDQTQYLNHFYLISLVSFLMIFLPANRKLALDSWLRPALQAESAPAWTLWLLRFQIGVAYFFGGIAKINPDWLAGEPMRIWLAYETDFPLIGQYFTEEWMIYLFSYGGLLFDLLIVPLLLWRRTRTPALIVMTLFHLSNAHMFSIGIFPWFMIATTVILFAPEWLTGSLLWRWGGVPDDASKSPPPTLSRDQQWVLALVGVYVAIQLLMPLRHWLYPGYVSWTEEGHNFSWHMKLRGKAGNVQIYVVDHQTQAQEQINLRDYLTPRQIDKMSSRPHMILQFSHYLVDELRRDGREGFGIYVRSWAALNARAWQMMIDPAVDLASQPRDIWYKPWVLPLEQPVHPS